MTGPSHVELFGLPGSGKTTLAERLGAERDGVYEFRDGYTTAVCDALTPGAFSAPCRRLPIRAVDALADAFGVRATPADQFIETARSLVERYTDNHERRSTVMGWVRDFAVRHATANERLGQRSTLLCDEGYLMRGNAVFCPANPTAELEFDRVDQYLSLAPRPDLVVLLDIPIAVSRRRMRVRESGPPASMAGQDEYEQARRLERMQKYAEHAYETLDADGIRCLRFRNDEQSIEDTTARLTEALP